MKLHIMSDLHLEGRDLHDYTVPECDVVVLAGDIAVGTSGVEWANSTFKVPVVYVPGNHEYYRRHQIGALNAKLVEVSAPHVHVLHDTIVHIDETKFVGGTLWTDFSLYGNYTQTVGHAEQYMNDYRLIERTPYGRLRASDTAALHKKTREFLEKNVDSSCVVVTHHVPTNKSVHDRFVGDLLTPAFASNLDSIIENKQPKLWVHGHTHDAFDYMVGKTRVVCNPRGYYGEDTGFNKQLVVEVV